MEQIQLAPSTSPSPLPDLSAGVPGWYADAACLDADPDLFFPEGRGARPAEAMRVCTGCAVRADCLAHALATDVCGGVWGGTTERQRRTLRRERRGS